MDEFKTKLDKQIRMIEKLMSFLKKVEDAVKLTRGDSDTTTTLPGF
jgi:hypothetical protein